jgi:hypothetical protein
LGLGGTEIVSAAVGLTSAEQVAVVHEHRIDGSVA